jgi:Helix-turn-helix domain
MLSTDPAVDTASKGRRIANDERRRLSLNLASRYAAGETIRSLAASTNRSYGWVHRLLTESGVRFRPRGGASHQRRRQQRS